MISWPVFCASETLNKSGGQAKLQARNICCLGTLVEPELEEWLLRACHEAIVSGTRSPGVLSHAVGA